MVRCDERFVWNGGQLADTELSRHRGDEGFGAFRPGVSLEFKICALVYNKKMIEYCIALFCCMDDSPLYILLCGLHSRTHRQAPFEARSRASAVRSDACSDRLEIGGLETKHSGSFGTDELDAVSLLGLVV